MISKENLLIGYVTHSVKTMHGVLDGMFETRNKALVSQKKVWK
jgi:hypothetical protein